MKKKGISLSLNFIIVVIVVVLAGATLITIFFNTTSGSTEQVDCDAKQRSACIKYTNCGCCQGESTCEDYTCSDSKSFEECETINLKEFCC